MQTLFMQVLHVEQMLTTAGGWQDQVGGLTGGLKIGISDAKLPVHIRVEFPVVPPDVLQDFSRRLISVYTGKTRLARNLLQVKIIILYLIHLFYVRPDLISAVLCLCGKWWASQTFLV